MTLLGGEGHGEAKGRAWAYNMDVEPARRKQRCCPLPHQGSAAAGDQPQLLLRQTQAALP